jgi:hypothetical protein
MHSNDHFRRFPHEARTGIRRIVDLVGTLGPPDMPGQDVRLLDISEFGCRISAPCSVSVGSEVQITLGSTHLVAAKLVWLSGDAAGCEFLKPIESSLIGVLTTSAPRRSQGVAFSTKSRGTAAADGCLRSPVGSRE